jgi:hypothetical protein
MSHRDAAYHERMILDEGLSLAFEIYGGIDVLLEGTIRNIESFCNRNYDDDDDDDTTT